MRKISDSLKINGFALGRGVDVLNSLNCFNASVKGSISGSVFLVSSIGLIFFLYKNNNKILSKKVRRMRIPQIFSFANCPRDLKTGMGESTRTVGSSR
jgi:hypothetical protein